MDSQYIYISVITAATLLIYRMSSYDVRRAWLKFGRGQILPKDDNKEFARTYRIQMNMIEHMVFFLPSLWLCALYFSVAIAQWFGAIWVFGRIWYAIGYFASPTRKPLGFHIALVMSLALFLCASAGLYNGINPFPAVPPIHASSETPPAMPPNHVLPNKHPAPPAAEKP